MAKGKAEGPLTIRYVDPRTLRPAERNPRIMPAQEMEALKVALERWGFVDPIVLRKEDSRIIGGHQRVTAAIELGMELVPVVEADVTALDAMILNEALNRIHGGWDEPQLALHQQEIRLAGGDLSLTGFTGREISLLGLSLGEKQGLTGDDAVPEPPAAPVAKRGDLWACGGHRLLCGDATKAEDVERLMAGGCAQLMVTDPPYGIDYDPAWRDEAAARGSLVSGSRRISKVIGDSRVDWREAWQLYRGDVAYVWHAARQGGELAEALVAVGFEGRAEIIWRKQHFTISRGHYHLQHEPCYYAVRKGRPALWIGGDAQTSIWDINRPIGWYAPEYKTPHPTQKPVECMERPIRNHDAPEVYDPFLGSGTTMIACEKLGRRCLGMEIEPRYVDVAVRRWEEFTGRPAEREPAKL